MKILPGANRRAMFEAGTSAELRQASAARTDQKGERTCRNDGALNHYLIAGSVARHTAASGIGADTTPARA